MTTLNLVPLRSKFPASGRMTLRYATPKMGTLPLEKLAEDDLDAALREFLAEHPGAHPSSSSISTTDTTTPQVAEGETTTRKSGQAR